MKLKIDIPTSLNEISLKQYKHYIKIQEKVKEDRFVNAKMIEIFCKIKLEDVMRLRLKDSQEISNILIELFNQKPNLVQRFDLDGVEYGFHPQLDELSLGEYIDLDSYIGDWDNIEKAMNVLYRPIVSKFQNKYNIEEYTAKENTHILNMPMDAVMSSIFFLWNLGIDLSQTMMNSLEGGQNEALTEYLSLQGNGDGINQFMDSLKEILQDLKVSLN